jgi:small subunit ribosomal protein S20
MANHKSSQKRIRQTEKKNELNRARRSKIRTITRSALEAVASGDAKAALTTVRTAESALARGVTKGVIHWKTAARKTSRLAKKAKALA